MLRNIFELSHTLIIAGLHNENHLTKLIILRNIFAVPQYHIQLNFQIVVPSQNIIGLCSLRKAIVRHVFIWMPLMLYPPLRFLCTGIIQRTVSLMFTGWWEKNRSLAQGTYVHAVSICNSISIFTQRLHVTVHRS